MDDPHGNRWDRPSISGPGFRPVFRLMIPVTSLLAFWLIGLFSCNRINPQPPAATGFDDSLTSGLSYVTAPIIFELSDLQNKINESLGKVLVGNDQLQNKKGKAWNLRVERSGPVQLAFDGKQLTFGAPLSIWLDNPLRIGKPDPNQEAFCSLLVRFSSPLSVQPNWRIRTRSTFTEYRWISPPKIRLLGLNITLTRFADRILTKRREMIEQSIDKAIHEELRLDKEISRIWRQIHKPLLLNRRYGEVWLNPRPIDITVGPVGGDSTMVTVPTRIRFGAETSFDTKPDVAIPDKLPALRTVSELPLVSEVNLVSRIPYAVINRRLSRTLTGRELDMTDHLLRVDRANVYGGGHTLVVQMEVGGAASGTLYLRGQPAYDTTDHTLRINNVSYDVHTQEILLSSADWLLHDRLQDTLQRAMTIPMKRYIDRIPSKIEQAFSRGKVGRKAVLDVRTFRFTPRKIAIRPEAIHILIHVDATLALRLKDI